MAEAFLRQLLTTTNRVESEDNAQCSVCLQTYGTLTDTGAIECEIRLPCNHRLGSMCAFIWLKFNNTCPFCREPFFPAQPHPNLENGIMGAVIPNPSVDTRTPETLDDDADVLSDIVRYCCNISIWDENVYAEVYLIAEPTAKNLRQLVQADGFCLDSIAGTAVYIASHVLGHPRSSLELCRKIRQRHARSFLEFPREATPVEDLIRPVYTRIYTDRENLIDPQMLGVLGRRHVEDVLAFLPPPDSDEEVIRDETEGPSFTISATALKSLCEQVSYLLGHRGSVLQLVQQIAETIRESPYLGVRLATRITAVSIFMAYHLAGLDTSYEQIQQFTGVAASTIRNTYRQLYPQRIHLVDSRSLEYIGRHDRHRALEVLISLSWPPLPNEISNNQAHYSSGPEIDEITDSLTQTDDVTRIYEWLCERVCTSLGLNAQVTELTYRLAVKIGSEDRAGASPESVAAVSIYIATRLIGRPLSYAEISTVVGLPRNVIRAFFQALARREELIQEVWLDFAGGAGRNGTI